MKGNPIDFSIKNERRKDWIAVSAGDMLRSECIDARDGPGNAG
jgi:hypothetical protein